MLESEQFVFDLKYLPSGQSGTGHGPKPGIRHAEGELVLFIGDDIIADECLLEEHLRAHATRHYAGAAVLGHIDWLKGLPRSRVMDFVCGESSLQFAYVHIPKLSALDYRFFYTSNVSVRRQFLVDAADAGITFDPDFRYAAFEDSEYTSSRETRARASLLRGGGRPITTTPWIWRALRAVVRHRADGGRLLSQTPADRRAASGSMDRRLGGHRRPSTPASRTWTSGYARSMPTQMHSCAALPGRCQELTSLQGEGISDFPAPKFAGDSLDNLLNSVLRVVFDVERTRGKVEEWYRGVEDRDKVEAAQRLLGLMRKLEFFWFSQRKWRSSGYAWLAESRRRRRPAHASAGSRVPAGARGWALAILRARSCRLACRQKDRPLHPTATQWARRLARALSVCSH